MQKERKKCTVESGIFQYKSKKMQKKIKLFAQFKKK